MPNRHECLLGMSHRHLQALASVLRPLRLPHGVALLSAATLRRLQDQPYERKKTAKKIVDLLR